MPQTNIPPSQINTLRRAIKQRTKRETVVSKSSITPTKEVIGRRLKGGKKLLDEGVRQVVDFAKGKSGDDDMSPEFKAAKKAWLEMKKGQTLLGQKRSGQAPPLSGAVKKKTVEARKPYKQSARRNYNPKGWGN